MTPVYHLEREVRKNKHYLAFCLAAPWTTDKVKGRPTLLTADGASRFLCLQEDSFEVLKALSGSCYYQGKKVVVDPFCSLEVVIELVYEGADTAYLTPKFRIGSQEIPFAKADWICLADPSWALISGIIRPIQGNILPKEGRIEGPDLFAFLKKAEGMICIEKKNEVALDPVPFLVLTDRHGAFANLGFQYGKLGEVFSHEFASSSWRNREAERGWEKDLLETGFCKRAMDNSHYYCPMDQVTRSLTFLLEIGWQVFDKEGRLIHRKKSSCIEAFLEGKNICIQGKLSYGDHEVNVDQVVGAFLRKEKFFEIAPSVVALIDQEQLSAEGLDLTEGDVKEGKVLIPQRRIGEVATLLKGAQIPYDHRAKLLALIDRIPSTPISPSSLFMGKLFPYQQKGLEWLSCIEGGLLADEMGLGKTVQLIAFFSTLQRTAPLLIVVPTSLLFNWEKEIRQFLPSALICRYDKEQKEWEKEAIVLVSYAKLRQDAAYLCSRHYQAVILDEAQTIKNPDSQIAMVCSALTADLRIAVTGTPIENRLEDLWSIFRFVQPGLLGERKDFNKEMTEKIRKRLGPFILRRTKEEVGLELPAKLEQTIFVQMSEEEMTEYEQLIRKTREERSLSSMQVLEAILRLRQFCAHPALVGKEGGSKLERVMEDLAEVVQERHKVLVYSQFTQMLGHIEQEVKAKGWNYAYLDGSTQNREEEVYRFQNDPSVSLFLISLKAGGVGLNLTAADYVFLYDPWWNVAVENQAIDRAHRLGRSSTVIARRYITALSIEEKIMTLKQHKQGLLQTLFGQEGQGALSLEELLALLD